MRKALILGATGLTGGHLLELLLGSGQYSQIKVISRRPLSIEHPKLTVYIGGFSSLEEMGDAFKADDIFCCIGTTIKKAGSKDAFRETDLEYPLKAAHLAQEAGAARFLIISSMGADTDSKFFYNKVKGQMEEQLKTLNAFSLHIFRPSLLVGDRAEFRLGEKAGEVFLKAAGPFMKGKLQKYKSIKALDVAKGMAAAAIRDKEARKAAMIYDSDEIARLAGK
ncbi:NAD(P)H-binding protein [Bacillus infantis]|uniref:NAD(P)H-binding protein n=1 Tax=Bacillus infantis TaxID=324767 RepID=UPI000B9AEC59|nr:NAD(P)H-binding protein [Bacillus infantis]MCK6204090.1 NAD(P)H-binding protein [Bacillus infantis]OXT16499.1 nucleoside-diphosphate sugar epimerase [Bacillus sp. OG2]